MIYIAAPFFTEKQVLMVESIENILEKFELDFYSPRSEGTLKDMDHPEKMYEVIYNTNVYHLNNADKVIGVIDDRDTGTLWELGYAAGLGKDIVTITNENYDLNVMIALSVRFHCKNFEDLVLAVTTDVSKKKTTGLF